MFRVCMVFYCVRRGSSSAEKWTSVSPCGVVTDAGGAARTNPGGPDVLYGRGLHSFTSHLTLSAFYGIGGARRHCVACVKGMLGGVYGV